jgi:hypothetical protein
MILTPFTRAVALPAVLLAAGGALAVLPATTSQAATTPLCNSQTISVGGGPYMIENNEWGSSAPECITTDGSTDFAVAHSAIANPISTPGGYPAIYKGCHWGACTPGSGFPIQVSDIHPGTVTTSWSTSQPGGSNVYNVAYDIWFNQTPTTSGQPHGAELMIWLNHNGPVHPFRSRVASNVSIGGRSYNVWFGRQAWNTISYTMTSGTTSVSHLDLQPFIADAVRRGYISRSWYLVDVEAGFEIWRGGAGLAANAFSVHVARGGRPAPRPALASTSPAPSPGLASGISLQAIAPNPSTPRTATNVTVDFKNIGSTVASHVTLVAEVLNSAGTVVGSEAWTGQNVAPQQTLNKTYTWTAASPAGAYTIEGLVRDSSGKTLQRARVGTLTVK